MRLLKVKEYPLDKHTTLALLFGGTKVEAKCNLDFDKLQNKFDNISKELDFETIEGAKKELQGQNSGIWNDPTKANYGLDIQHLTKVRNARNGLVSRIEKIQNQLNYKGLTDSERKALQSLLNEYQATLSKLDLEIPNL